MLWHKGTQAADWVTRFTVGDDYLWDQLLIPYDVTGTRGHIYGLVLIDILTESEAEALNKGLDELLVDYEADKVVVRPADEDCHTVIEGYLTEKLGDIGKKVHTGRSRNDQVLTAVRLWLRDALAGLIDQTKTLGMALCKIAETYQNDMMPGYTHFQRAMPTTAGLWAASYAELLISDIETLKFASKQINVSPLGSAAGYGVPWLNLQREKVAAKLGFEGLQENVPAVQLSRGKLELQAMHAIIQVAATINRLSSDLVLFNTAEYGFVTLPAEYCTGSSIMPQKQNPDVLELARATYHRVLAEMNLILTLPANLPSGYHRDLQLTKAALMRGVLTVQDLLTAMNHLMPGVGFDREKMLVACTPELHATAVALEQVRAGVPFRDAYRAAGKAVSEIDPPSPEEALAAYKTVGFPGNANVERLKIAFR